MFISDLVRQQSAFLKTHDLNFATELAESLSILSVSWFLANDLSGMEEIMHRHMRFSTIDYVLLLSPSLQVMAHSDAKNMGKYATDAVSRKLLKAGRVTTVLINEKKRLDVAAPIIVNAELIGWARIGFTKTHELDNEFALIRNGILYTLLALVVGLIFAYLMGRGVTRGLRALVTVTESVSQGDIDKRVVLNRDDELGQLGQDLNKMLDALFAAQQELNRSKEQLALSEQRFSLAMSGSKDGLWDWNIETDQVYYSEQWAVLVSADYQQLGTSLDEWKKRLVPRYKENVVSRLMQHINGLGENYSSIHQVISDNGNVRWYHERGRVIRKNNKPVRIIVTSSDITQQKESDERLRRNERALKSMASELENRVQQRTSQLEQANKELESFAYSVSHDLRAPLRAISGFSNIVATRFTAKLETEANEYLARIISACERMSELIDGLLALSRITRSPIAFISVDLSAIAHNVIDNMKELSLLNNVELVIHPDMHVFADKLLMHAVMTNLIDNAIKFSGKVAAAKIEVGCEHINGVKTYFVKDNGAGFDPEYADKLFGAFQRLHHQSDYAGTGIGLATVQRIISKHNGVIWAESSPGQGAAFYFQIESVVS
ncbi:MAG: ATP-binding protein [Gammaproteobacteria bacterium]|nr:ATP-binding protein [Gammaproteobacteria bacterium]